MASEVEKGKSYSMRSQRAILETAERESDTGAGTSVETAEQEIEMEGNGDEEREKGDAKQTRSMKATEGGFPNPDEREARRLGRARSRSLARGRVRLVVAERPRVRSRGDVRAAEGFRRGLPPG